MRELLILGFFYQRRRNHRVSCHRPPSLAAVAPSSPRHRPAQPVSFFHPYLAWQVTLPSLHLLEVANLAPAIRSLSVRGTPYTPHVRYWVCIAHTVIFTVPAGSVLSSLSRTRLLRHVRPALATGCSSPCNRTQQRYPPRSSLHQRVVLTSSLTRLDLHIRRDSWRWCRQSHKIVLILCRLHLRCTRQPPAESLSYLSRGLF